MRAPRESRRIRMKTLPIAVILLTAVANTSRAAIDLEADSRLSTKVSLSMGGTTLQEALNAVEKQVVDRLKSAKPAPERSETGMPGEGKEPGVSLDAGRDAKDWFARDLPVSVFVEEMPLRDLMVHLAALTGFHWSATGDGDAPGYRLWQDLKARQGQDALRRLNTVRKIDAERERRLEDLAAFASLGNLSDDALREMDEKDPTLSQFLALPGFSSMGKIIGAMPPEQRKAAATGEGVRLPFKDMSPAMQDEVKRAVHGWRLAMSKVDPDSIDLASSPEPPLDDAVVVVRSRRSGELEIPGVSHAFSGMFSMEGVDLGVKTSLTGFPIFNPRAPEGRLVARYLTLSMQDAPQMHRIAAATEELNRISTSWLTESEAEPAVKPSDPDLVKPVAFEMEERRPTLGDLLEALHRASGLNMIADDLPQSRLEEGVPGIAGIGRKAPLYRVLARLRSLCGLRWDKEGKTIRLQDVDWPEKRTWLMPRDVLTRWKAKAASEAGLTPDDLLELPTLTAEQLAHNFGMDRNAAALTLAVTRFIAALTGEQERLLPIDASGLEFGSLSVPQRNLLRDALSTVDPSLTGPIPEKGLLFVLPSPDAESAPPAKLLRRKVVILAVRVSETKDGKETTREITLPAAVTPGRDPSWGEVGIPLP